MSNIASEYYKKRPEFFHAMRNNCADAYLKLSQTYRRVTGNSRSEARNDEINHNLAQLSALHRGIEYRILKRCCYEAFILHDDIHKVMLVVKRESAIDMRRRDYDRFRKNWLAMLLKEVRNPEHKYKQLSWDEDFEDYVEPHKLLPEKYRDYTLLFVLHYGDVELNGMQIIYTDERFEVLERCDIDFVPEISSKPEELVELKLKGNLNVTKDRKKA
ncbi:DUF5986 family protein [Geovibrio ferrireducens]|uniref:DUF5986 family protein n=1 Tax=Geovibrio ferrireducens TaxID=46201 RepID=UPI0022470FA5|nr:DUF5986 family protein [Geovibrio ferrireducens]